MNLPIQIDNTGLHSASKVFLNEKRTKDNCKIEDIDGLVQLCLLVIFSDKIFVNGFETETIIEKTDYILDFTNKYDLKDIIQKHDKEEERFYHICEKASRRAAEELIVGGFVCDEKEVLRVAPDGLDEKLKNIRYGYLDIIKRTADLEEIKAESKLDKMEGAVLYMLASNTDLMKVIDGFGSMSKNKKYQLNAYLRVILNNEFARDYGTFYAPAVVRGRILDTSYNNVLNRFSEEIRKKLMQASQKSVKALPLEYFLLEKAQGDPIKMIETALRVREKSKGLRMAFGKILTATQHLDALEKGKMIANVDEEINHLASNLEIKFGQTGQKGQLLRALSGFLIEAPMSKIKQYLKMEGKETKVTLITEISDAQINQKGNINSYKELFYNK